MARHERRVGYGLPTLLAIGVHVLVLLLTVLRWPESEATPSSSSVVQATLVSTETTIDQAQRVEEAQASAAQAKQAEEAAEAASEAEQAEIEEARQQAEAEAQAAREAEQQAREQARQQAEAEAERRAEEAARQAELRRQAEQQRQEQAREEAAEAKRQAEQEAREQAEAAKRQAEQEAREQAEAAKRQAEQEAREQAAEAERQAEEEARRKAEAAAEAERQRQQALKRAAEAAASSLDSVIAGEAQAIANAKQAAQASNSFINLVRNAVEQAWILPSGSNGKLEALVSIQLLPTGELISASISKSSGDAAFDRSVLLAVERAAPFREMSALPASAQSQFRDFNLRFNPEDVRQ